MLTRTALYEGTVQKGREEEFFRRVRDELEPIWQRFPNVRAVRVQRTTSADPDARPIAMILEMDFENKDARKDLTPALHRRSGPKRMPRRWRS